MNQKPLIVEYLIIIRQDDTFCDSDKAFLKFLAVDSRLLVSEEHKQILATLKKGIQFKVSFSLVSDLVLHKKERYFKLTLSSNEHERLGDFEQLIKLIENIVSRLNTEVSINILWNDIARLYAIKGYSYINEVENLLRRLITNFMLINVGYDWHKYHIPSEVESRNIHLKTNYSDILHQTYFKDLKTILFEGQRDINFRNIGDIQKLVERYISSSKKDIPIEELKGVISKSLWEQHFSKETDYKKKNLEEDLDQLNDLRNNIAHNRHIDRESLGKVENLSKKIIKTLKLELEDLPNKILTIEEQSIQSEREDNRILKFDSLSKNRILNSIYEKYKLKYGVISLSDHLRKGELLTTEAVVDFVITIDQSKEIAVQIKQLSIGSLNTLIKQTNDGINIENYFSPNFTCFHEYHFIMVVKDYLQNESLTSLTMLKNILVNVNKNIHVFLGYMNEEDNFVEVPLFTK